MYQRVAGEEEFIRIEPGLAIGDRIVIGGPHNSLFKLHPTNIFVGGEVADDGDYNCSVCRMYSQGDTRTCLSMDSRVTTLFMIGHAPPALKNRSNGCDQ